MSDTVDRDERDPAAAARRRAVWGLGVLAIVAILVGTLMVLLGGSNGGKQKNGLDLPITTPPTTVSGSPTSSASTTSAPPTTPAAHTTTPMSAGRSGNPCPGQRACAVDGDGGVIAAVNAYRAAHGRKTVPAAVSAAAVTCALHKGADRYCAAHWIWTPVPSQSGTACVQKFTGFNPGWLLDAKARSFSVGWAYVDGTYQCVATKVQAGD